MNRQELLSRYKTFEENPYAKKQKKKQKVPKNSSTRIIDESDDWGRQVDGNVDISVDFESQFIKQDLGWNLVDEGQLLPSQPTSRRSPSLSPQRQSRTPRSSPTNKLNNRKSPSISPTRFRRSHSTTSDELRARQRPSKIDAERGSIEKRVSTRYPQRISDRTGLNSREQNRQQFDSQEVAGQGQGQFAETIYRNNSGVKIDIGAQKAEQMAEQRRIDEIAERKMEWGRGLVQSKEIKEMAAEAAMRIGDNLATYNDDKERNDALKGVVRWGDAMAQVVEIKTKKSKIVGYQGEFTPNRYGIRPGFRWDGIDRSNGWELKIFRAKHQNREAQQEYHRWATEDM